MNRMILSLLVSGMLLLCSACQTEQKPLVQPTDSLPESQIQDNTLLSMDISEIPFYEVLQLSENEQVTILDVSENRLLLNIYKDYEQNDPQFKEEGYNSATKRVEIYDISEGQTVSSLEMPSGAFCTDACFLQDGFAYVTLSPVKGEPAEYSIEVYENGNTTIITSGICFETGFDEPQVEAMGDTVFAYSFYDLETKRFGVNIASAQGKIVPQISLVDDGSTEHLRTTLVGNGEKYIYYAAVESKGTIFVGDEKQLEHQFALPRTERLYEYCFVENGILFTMEKSDAGTANKTFVVKDFEGNNLLENGSTALYRLESNGENIVLGIDGNYSEFLIYITENNISTLKLDVDTVPVRFYCLSDGTFLLHHYRTHDGSAPTLLRLTVQD